MKDKFSEYYSLTQEEIKNHWNNDLFSFDANVLLNLYRYTPTTRDSFFALFEKIKDRVWVSYQAAYEYQKNRLSVISAQKEAYEDIRDILKKKKQEIENNINGYKKHPYLETKTLVRQIESAFGSISADLDNVENKHPDYSSQDPVFDRLTNLFSNKVGDDLSPEDLDKLFKEGAKRYGENIPPGYMDARSKKNVDKRSLYGDLIVWKQVIQKAENANCSIIFVTDDLKEDWWYKFKGRTIGPRPELLKEFRDKTTKRINIYQADRFLEYANTNLAQQTDQKAIDEVRNVRLADEEEIQSESLATKDIETVTAPEEQQTPKSGLEIEIDDRIQKMNEEAK